MASTAKALRDRCGEVIKNARERLAQMASGKAYTAIDTRDDSVYRYGYGAQSSTTQGLLDAEEASERHYYNNTYDREDARREARSPRTRSRSSLLLYSPEVPSPLEGNGNGREMTTFNNLTTAGVQRMGHLSGGGGATAVGVSHEQRRPSSVGASGSASELMATTAVADELARVVWDLSAVAEQSPEKTTQDDLRLLEQMANDAKELQGQLMQQLSSYDGSDETVFESALESNDALQNVLSGYEDIITRITVARHSAAANGGAANNRSSSNAVVGAIDPTNLSEEEIIRRLQQQNDHSAAPVPAPTSALPDLIRMDSATDINALASNTCTAPVAQSNGQPASIANGGSSVPVVVHGTAIPMAVPQQPSNPQAPSQAMPQFHNQYQQQQYQQQFRPQ